MHKREFVMVFIAFFGCLGLGIFIGMAGPPITSTTEIDGKSLLTKDNRSHSTNNEIATGPFTMRSPAMTTYSQQMWLIAKLTTDNNDDEILDKSFQVSISIEGLTVDHKPVTIIDSNHSKNRTRHLRCVRKECDEFIVLHLVF
ncbi:transmembrane protein [Holotrichia oblita]|uniref:Transmembrane protein n=1 Tax=Holotrichia oblita TaxID=644536 RepID=A0ACB9SS63_HOLOL|nr:transmembrane protein [Holotrichia oblita]